MTVRENIIREHIYLYTYIVYICTMVLYTSALAVYVPFDLSRLVRLLSVFVLLANDLMNSKYTLKRLIVAILLLVLGLINYLIVPDGLLISSLMFIFCAHGISFRKIALCTIYVLSFMLILIIICAKTGLIANYMEISIFRERDYLGFLYPLYPASLFCNVVFLYIYCKKWSISWCAIILLAVLNTLMLTYTEARLSGGLVYIFLFMISFCKVLRIYNIKNRVISTMIIASYILCCAVSIYATLGYNPGDIDYVLADYVLSGRLALGYKALITYPITMFGTKLPLVGNGLDINGLKSSLEYFWIDCVYIKLLLQYGLIIFILYLLAFTQLLYMCHTRKKLILMIIIMLMGIHGMISDEIIYLTYNPFLLLIGTEFSVQKNTADNCSG